MAQLGKPGDDINSLLAAVPSVITQPPKACTGASHWSGPTSAAVAAAYSAAFECGTPLKPPPFEKTHRGRSTESLASTSTSGSCGSCAGTSMAMAAAGTRGSEKPMLQEAAAPGGRLVQDFVRSFVKGSLMSVVNATGGTTECLTWLDRELTTLTLQPARGNMRVKRRAIRLDRVNEIIVGQRGAASWRQSDPTAVESPLDELCSTLLLEDGSSISFTLRISKSATLSPRASPCLSWTTRSWATFWTMSGPRCR